MLMRQFLNEAGGFLYLSFFEKRPNVGELIFQIVAHLGEFLTIEDIRLKLIHLGFSQRKADVGQKSLVP